MPKGIPKEPVIRWSGKERRLIAEVAYAHLKTHKSDGRRSQDFKNALLAAQDALIAAKQMDPKRKRREEFCVPTYQQPIVALFKEFEERDRLNIQTTTAVEAPVVEVPVVPTVVAPPVAAPQAFDSIPENSTEIDPEAWRAEIRATIIAGGSKLLGDMLVQALRNPDVPSAIMGLVSNLLLSKKELKEPPKKEPPPPENKMQEALQKATQEVEERTPKPPNGIKKTVLIVGPDARQVGALEQEFGDQIDLRLMVASDSKDKMRNTAKIAAYSVSTLPMAHGPIDAILRSNVEDPSQYKHISGFSHLRDFLGKVSQGLRV